MQLVELRENLRDEHAAIQEKALTLRRLARILTANGTLNDLVAKQLAGKSANSRDEDERAFLDANDVSNGLRFNDAFIPTLTLHDNKINLVHSATQQLDSIQDATDLNTPTGDAGVALTIESSYERATENATRRATSTVPNSDDDDHTPITYSQKAREESDGPVALPAQVAPPQPEDEVEFSAKTQELVDSETPHKPAKVVHLPPEDVSEERRHEVAEARHGRSEDNEATKHSKTHLQAQNELASSPSSTVGAYSATTPLAPQDSPDTSPDSENAEQIEVLPPKDMRPSPDEQREKEQHDRILAAQKDIARRQALGDVSTADDQLRWEERAAAARDAEEKAARDERNVPEADAKSSNDETMAEEVMEGIEESREEDQIVALESERDSKAVADPATTSERTTAVDAQEDGDNITVTPRNKLPLSIDTSKARHTPVEPAVHPTPGEQERMTTRTTSGALQRRSVSEMLGQTPSRREVMSPDGISPFLARHPQNPAAASSISTFQLPRRPAPTLTHHRTASGSQTALDELSILKGASEDPDKDYLEPLFRIQAHESPNFRGTSLPELVKTATKTVSTEDQFSNLHERLDYRILRRIYQLQNANKWSLRQMEKQKEPVQPITHHDHLMAEMQWMRKDFKAERKMKKSVCAWLAQRCADWVVASAAEKLSMQVKVRPQDEKALHEDDDQTPDLEPSGESPIEDDAGPTTPPNGVVAPINLIIAPELSDVVTSLQKSGRLRKALDEMPVTGFSGVDNVPPQKSFLTPVSKFVGGKVLPRSSGPPRKRSRFDYEDETEEPEDEPDMKRLRVERDLPPEDQDNALFHPDNKAVRARLHANNAFRPPSEFVMPSTQFYEFRNGSQWLAEDDKRLRDLAKEYSFNWSLIADELQLPGIFKSSAERRTPWECFERWVELEQLPTEMKKTIYFKTWYQRLEQSQQAAERRYQAQIAALQAASNGHANHVPMRRRTVPTRVEKRKNTRYLWLVDAMRKLARKKEQKAYKEAESHRAAAQRKTQTENNPPRAQPMLTPQEFSRKRYERDLQMQEAARAQKQKMMEEHQRRMQAMRQAAAAQQAQQQGAMPNGTANPQRPGSSSNMAAQQAQMQANGQQQASMNGQMSQQPRQQGVPVQMRGGHLAVPQMGAQGMPQAQMRPNGQMSQEQMQRIAHANAQQARNPQYPGQQYQMPSANMMSPGNSGMSAQQLHQSSQAMLTTMQQQMSNPAAQQQTGQQLNAGSPSMPPPPTPQNAPQQLSSGHMPAILNIKAQLRNKYPTSTEDQINQMATEILKSQSQSSSQARQNAMNAAAGISNMQAYAENQAAAFQNQQMQFMNGDASGQQGAMSPASPQQYAAMMRARQMAQMTRQSPNATHATLNNGSPSLTHASPNMQPNSPNMAYSNMNQMAGMNMGGMNGQQQRPPSRSNTPQVQRLGSSGNTGMPSPQGVNGMQGSPRSMQANMAR